MGFCPGYDFAGFVRGNGKGGVQAVASIGSELGQTYTLAIADMDNDGDMDIVAGNVQQKNVVLFNIGNGIRYTDVAFGDESTATYGLCVGDLDGDRYPDIAVANSDSENRLFLNRPQKKQ